MTTAFFEAKGQRDDRLAEFLRDRFRPGAKAAFDAWLDTDPFNNPSAPKNPFEMKEYTLVQEREAKRLDEESAKLLDSAQTANVTSDAYVLLTVLFASVLLFGGIAGTFQSRPLRIAAVSIAAILFLGTICTMVRIEVDPVNETGCIIKKRPEFLRGIARCEDDGRSLEVAVG